MLVPESLDTIALRAATRVMDTVSVKSLGYTQFKAKVQCIIIAALKEVCPQEDRVTREEYEQYAALQNDRHIACNALWVACEELDKIAAVPGPENVSFIHDRIWRKAKQPFIDTGAVPDDGAK